MDSSDFLVIAAGIFGYALVSRRGERGSVTAPMVLTVFGLIIGEAVLDLVNLPVDNAVLDGLAELTLVLALFTDAARIDVTRISSEHDVPLRLLGIGLPLTMGLGAGAAWWLFPDLGLWQAAVIGVILAPTDAALGQAVVTNERIPQRIRQALNVESGLNDGLAFPVLLIVLSLAFGLHEGRSTGGWGLFVLQQVGLGPLVGAAVGLGGARAVDFCARRAWMNKVFLQIAALSLAILAFGAAETVGGNGFIAAFAAGMAVAGTSRRVLDGIEEFGETEGQLLNLVVFLLFGAVLLPDAFADLNWRHLVYAALSLTVLRMLPVAICLIGTRLMWVTVAFLGWFGPRGLASILYLLLAMEAAGLQTGSDIVPAVLITVAGSILLHGASAAPMAAAYGRLIDMRARDRTAPERQPVFPFPTRIGHARSKQTPTE